MRVLQYVYETVSDMIRFTSVNIMFTSSTMGCIKWLTALLRFHSLIWASFGLGVDGCAGRLVGGCENGTITVYNPDIILASGEEAIVGKSTKHTGPVRALDYNPFQVSTNSLLCMEFAVLPEAVFLDMV